MDCTVDNFTTITIKSAKATAPSAATTIVATTKKIWFQMFATFSTVYTINDLFFCYKTAPQHVSKTHLAGQEQS